MELDSTSGSAGVARSLTGVALPAAAVALGYLIGAGIGFAQTPAYLIVTAIALLLLLVLFRERRTAQEAHARMEQALGQATTAQRRVEAEAMRQHEQLTHLSRVAVLGELSGAFAHELNQPLAAILTNAQAAHRFLARDPPDLPEIRAILDDIVAEDKRAGEVIRRLRALFLKGDALFHPVDINELVRDSVALARSKLGERRVRVLSDLTPQPAMVRGDRVQLQQVLLNLLINACEAMDEREPGQRTLRVETARSPPDCLRILVSDSGKGIEPALLERIFEPFFSTKRHGLGFGLSISRAIVDRHGGQLDAHNNEAGGSTFRVTLPIYREGYHE